MKKWVLLVATFVRSFSLASPIQDHLLDPKALSVLADGLDIPKKGNIIEETQNRWLRKVGQEKWEMSELSSEKSLFVLDWAEKQGLFSPWNPLEKTYDIAVILGTVTPHMQKRLDYLKKLWVEGIRFTKVVWLTGDRPLDKRVDGLTDRCSTESEAAHILWEETDLPL